MSHLPFLRFSHVHLFRFLPGVPGTLTTTRFSRRARLGVVATDDRVRFWFRFADGSTSRTASIGVVKWHHDVYGCRRRPTTGIGKRGLSLIGRSRLNTLRWGGWCGGRHLWNRRHSNAFLFSCHRWPWWFSNDGIKWDRRWNRSLQQQQGIRFYTFFERVRPNAYRYSHWCRHHIDNSDRNIRMQRFGEFFSSTSTRFFVQNNIILFFYGRFHVLFTTATASRRCDRLFLLFFRRRNDHRHCRS